MNVPLTTDGWIAFDADGEYLTLFLDEPMQDGRGRWYIENPSRLMVVNKPQNAGIVFEIGDETLAAGEKLRFVGLELEA